MVTLLLHYASQAYYATAIIVSSGVEERAIMLLVILEKKSWQNWLPCENFLNYCGL